MDHSYSSSQPCPLPNRSISLALASCSFYFSIFSSLPGIPLPTLHPIYTPGHSLHDLGLFPHQELKGLAVSGQEDPLEKGIATHSSTLAWKIWQATVPGITESDTTKRTRAQGGFPTLDSSYILSSKPPYFFHSISNSPHESLQIMRLNT